MNVPKIIRKWKYKKILKKIDNNDLLHNEIYLCLECKHCFPYIKIKYYPELWDRRLSTPWYDDFEGSVWFRNDKERRQYVLKALDLVTKTK